ncbi:MAG: deoxyhypusine synthase [Thermoplasmata archaeon]|jgi:deoxyhypusine synthase
MPRKVEDIRIDDAPSLDALVRRMEAGGGFSAKAVAQGVDVLAQMLRDPDLTLFLSFPADIVATGLRGVLATLVREGYVDVVITTCGTLDHDLARSFRPYYHGEWNLDDADLHRRHLYRLGNLVIPEANYGAIIEQKMQKLLAALWRRGVRSLTTRDLAWAIGEAIPARSGRSSILRAAYERKVPVFVPGITDGAVGSQLWLFWQDHKELTLDLLRDEQHISDLVYEAKRSGAILLGGGISKHHTIWWNQFRDGLDAALQVTSAVEWDGSLSGARTREAVSWGKIKANAHHTSVDGDVTVLFPLMVGAALERLRR